MVNHENDSTVENLCALVRALFCEVDISNVLSGEVVFDCISCERAARLAVKTQKLYEWCSELECQKRMEAISDGMWRRDRYRMRRSIRGKIHVFELLADLVECLLLVQNSEILCRYEEVLNWRELIQSVGEEIPVSTMYAICDLARGESARKNFTWDFVTKQNNEALNMILRRGISDHHMHLWPSVPYFQVSWLNLMNRILDGDYVRRLNWIDRTEWNIKQKALNFGDRLEDIQETAGRIDSLVTLHRQAALIRVYLCSRLKGFDLNLWEKSEENDLREDKQRKILQRVQYLLIHPEELYIESSRIQNEIASLRQDADEIDYMLRMFEGRPVKSQNAYAVFSGERWFLYSVVQDIYLTHPKLNQQEQNLFYAYLLIMIRLRSKLVQTNQRVGFDNFQRIQQRKGYFLGDAQSTELIMRMAIREPLRQKPYLREMEVRITPRDTAEKILQDILALERDHTEDPMDFKFPGEQEQKRYYYVLHFIKQPDEGLDRLRQSAEGTVFLLEYRHTQFRKKVKKTAQAIMLFRERYSEAACRVGGIDACSQEIGCRPEVFATAFRTLGEHSCVREEFGQKLTVPRLRKTYHVGEDFLDLADGLRAIDEAVLFLNLDYGDRLGHALALCIEPKSWYEAKKMQISIPVQDYLDNIAWLYHALRRYRVPGQENVVHFLEKEFEYYFNRIYLSNFREEELDSIMDAAVKDYQDDRAAERYHKHSCIFTIEHYCGSWMLRGDHPSLYRNGYFKPNKIPLDEWDRHSANRCCPANVDIRYTPECSLLYYLYHYSSRVKYTGMEVINVTVDQEYITAVQVAQRELQFEIARRGIGVESNPTSNVKISTLRSYSKHPITTLYNRGLVHSPEKLCSCAQINVSINTDDSGVFFTSLESEYAVMARALELAADAEGNPCFCKWEINEWMNQVRKIGNEQSFLPNPR
ncbi:hypothetical protein [Lawsonibacter sp. JLR.KK007]|jgi:hypothetical protein|uniref:hypothetical protein n=1 Tax=Lawsonibacter sp. JLR.KK007 TaxID=3114293 RepID=UPI002FF0903E